jgi:hypothetical protein
MSGTQGPAGLFDLQLAQKLAQGSTPTSAPAGGGGLFASAPHMAGAQMAPNLSQGVPANLSPQLLQQLAGVGILHPQGVANPAAGGGTPGGEPGTAGISSGVV